MHQDEQCIQQPRADRGKYHELISLGSIPGNGNAT